MHVDQVDVPAEVVAALVAEQFPEWRGLPVRPLPTTGTVNALFRLGAEIVLRFPLQPTADPELRAELRREQEHARLLGPHLPTALPEPLGLGEPGPGTGPWTAYRWIPGEPIQPGRVGDLNAFARDLAAVVTALHRVDTGGQVVWPGSAGAGRWPPTMPGAVVPGQQWPAHRHRPSRRGVGPLPGHPRHDSADVWIHADLMPGNLLVRDGRLAAVIDLGTVNVGDPAVDLIPAWNLFDAASRETYRRALGVDDATWERGVAGHCCRRSTRCRTTSRPTR
ncbi:phosphotransferase [Micromonospora sp. M12]